MCHSWERERESPFSPFFFLQNEKSFMDLSRFRVSWYFLKKGKTCRKTKRNYDKLWFIVRSKYYCDAGQNRENFYFEYRFHWRTKNVLWPRVLLAIYVSCKKTGWACLVTLWMRIKLRYCMCIFNFKSEWAPYAKLLWDINSNDFANPKIQSSYTIPHHFRNMLPHKRTTFLREGYIRFQTFTNENRDSNIRLSSAGSHPLSLAQKKVSLMVTAPKWLNGNLREKIEKTSTKNEVIKLIVFCCDNFASKIERVWAQDTNYCVIMTEICTLLVFFICFSILHKVSVLLNIKYSVLLNIKC